MRYSWMFQFGFLITFLIVSMGCSTAAAKGVIIAGRASDDVAKNPLIRGNHVRGNHVSDDVVKSAEAGDNVAINKIAEECFEDTVGRPLRVTLKGAIEDVVKASIVRMLEQNHNSQIVWDCDHIRKIVMAYYK